MVLRSIARLPVVAAGALFLAMRAAASESDWRGAIDRFADEKTLAEGCAAILKSGAVDHPMVRVQGERLYARAQADEEGLIALLAAGLGSARSPAAVPGLTARLQAVPRQRQALCRHVDAAVDTTAGIERGRAAANQAELLRRGVGGADAALVEAAEALWTAYRSADGAERQEMRAMIAATRWRPYALLQAPRPRRDAAYAPNRPRGRKNRTAAMSR